LPDLLEHLIGILRPGGYDPGDVVSARVKDIDEVEHQAQFEIEKYCGGGFAGQVYRARLVSCDDTWLPLGSAVALKFFSPRSGFRRFFRDILYFLSFQGPFPHQYNEASVRTGLYLTRALRWVSQVEFGSECHINDCHGTFWDDHICAFAEVQEWVEGRITDPEVDSGILTRWRHNRRVRRARRAGTASELLLESTGEIAAKKAFMNALVKVCAGLGLDDLARQVYWWTGMSQANVLTRNSEGRPPEFVWVDRRPGLPGWLLSLGDFPLLAQAIQRGSIPPFDRIDFGRLRGYPKAPDRAAWQSVVDRLQAVDEEYRGSQLDLFGHRLRLITSGRLRQSVARGIVDYWHRTGRVDDRTRDGLLRSWFRIIPHVLVSCVPVIGRRAHKFIGSAAYRGHVRRVLLDYPYTWEYLDRARKTSVAGWRRDNRTSDARAERLLRSIPLYLLDRICFWWSPASWQLFLTDWAYAWRSTKRAFANSYRYIFDLPYRRHVNLEWVRQRTDEDVRHGYVSREEAEVFVSTAGADAMQQYITGIMVTIALLPASEITFVLLAAAGLASIKDFESLREGLRALGWWALPLGLMLLTMSPGGVMRFLYCVCQWIRHPRVSYAAASALALFRAVGYLSFPVQIARTYPQFSGYLLTWSVCHLVNMVPVFGERGGLLNIWATTVLLSWPASARTWRAERRHERHREGTTGPDATA